MSQRRKYEDARGVVPIRWHSGPWIDHRPLDLGELMVAEVWDATLGFDSKFVRVDAALLLVTRDPQTRTILFGGEKLGKREVRRWAVLGRAHTTLNLTVQMWEAPDAK